MGARTSRIPPPLHRSSAVEMYWGLGGGLRPLPTQVLSQLSHWRTAHTRKSQGQWRGQEDWEYVQGRREAEPEDQPLSGGSGSHCTEALGLWGTEKGMAPSLFELLPQSDRPPTVWYGGQKERGEQRLLLGPNGGERRGLGKGDVLQSSVIPLALSSSCTRVR